MNVLISIAVFLMPDIVVEAIRINSIQSFVLEAGNATNRRGAAGEDSGDQESHIRNVDRIVSVGVCLIIAQWGCAACEYSRNQECYIGNINFSIAVGVAVACLVPLGLRAIEPVPTWVLKGARMLHLA